MEFLVIFFFGAIWGSFFYTLSIRYIRGSFIEYRLKALFSKSRCPECKGKIRAVHLIPIVGYLILKGRCNNCGIRISPLYPAFEIIYGVLLILIVSKYGENIYAITIFLIAGVAISISMIDLKTFTIPDSLIIAFIILSIYPIIINSSLKDSLSGFLFMFLFFIIMLLLFPGSFGGGDIKFASTIGMLFGMELSIVTLEIALISGSFIGIMYALKTKRGLRIKIPFAPFLALGVITSFLYGRDIVIIYYGFIY